MSTDTAQAPQPLPEPEQASPSQLDADATVQSAVRFLQDPRVQKSPVEAQIRFLKGKSMSDTQIQHAFTKVGRSVTAEKIASVRAPAPVSAVLAPAQGTAVGGLASQLKARPLSPMPATAQPQYSQTLFPRAPAPQPEEPQGKGVDWRDVVIGAGAAVLAGVAGYKLFNRYSPYEIRRKGEKKTPRSLRGNISRSRLPINASSESETDASSLPHPSRAPPPPLPPPPAAVEPATAPAPAVDAEELKRLQTQLEEAKEALTNERKKCADLAVGSAKIRAEKQQLSRANDRLTQQVDALKKDIEKLEEEKAAAASSEGKLTAAEEEPPKTFYPSLTTEAEQARGSQGGSAVSAVAPLSAASAAALPPVVGSNALAELAGAVAPPAVPPQQPIVETFPVPQPQNPVPPAPAAAPVSAAEPPAAPPAAPVVETAPVIPAAFLTPDPIQPEAAAASSTE